MPLVGEAIHLNNQLSNGATDKFVRAFLFDNDGNNLGTEDLTHAGEGKYISDNVAMPNVDAVHATYIVFNDALFTDAAQFTHGTDLFIKESLLPTQLPSAENITANFGEDPVLKVSIDDLKIKVKITSDELNAKVMSDGDVKAKQDSEPNIDAGLKSDKITARFEC